MNKTNQIFDFATNETKAEYIERCGTDNCDTCKKDMPKDWGQHFLGGKFECVICEEMRHDAKEE